MSTEVRKQVKWLVLCVVVLLFSILMSSWIQGDFGKVEVSTVNIMTPDGEVMAAKVFKPYIATPDNPQAAVINMHGYQNDKGAQDPASVELARRGFVVIAPDALGHADTTGGIAWGTPGGNQYIVEYAIGLPFVDAENIGVMGHSMGGMNAVQLPALFPDNIKGIAQQASEPGSPELPNVLMLQAKYEEFEGFREGQFVTTDLINNPDRLAKLGLTEPAQWDTTYGNVEDGTLRRMAYIPIDHHLLPLMNKTNAEVVDWFRITLKGGDGGPMWIEPTSQIFMWKEIFGFIAMLVLLISLLPLTNLLLASKYFSSVSQPMPTGYIPNKKVWWKVATINVLLGAIIYPVTTNWGGIGGKIEFILPFMKLEMGNGVAAFFFVSALVGAIMFYFWYRKAAKTEGVTMYDMGMSFDKKKTVLDWNILGKTAFVGFVLFMWMYVLTALSQNLLGMEIRFGWPYFRQFHTMERAGYFVLYLIPALMFFLVNGGIFLFGQARLAEYETPKKTQWMWWVYTVYAMVAGLFLVWLFQYLPWFLGAGPGFEITGITGNLLMQISTSMWPLMLFVYIPEFLILYWFLVWFFRKTGKIYLGAIIIASIATWFLAAGSILLP